MTLWIMLWAIAAVIFLALDMLWLLWLGRGFYVDEIGALLRETPSLAAAGAFYVLYVAGLVFFVIKPAFMAGSISQALIHGALLGLLAYGTYDLTNLAVLKGFTMKIAIIDMAWGSLLTGMTAAITVWVSRLFPV
jgi:uncharacterized membrane protein